MASVRPARLNSLGSAVTYTANRAILYFQDSILLSRTVFPDQASMTGPRATLAFALSFLAGILLWSVTAWAGHRSEPWDSDIYWSAAYPLSLLISAALGFLFPLRPWRWAAILIFSQLLVMLARGSGLSLLPLGLVMLVCLTLPAAALAWAGARVRSRLM